MGISNATFPPNHGELRRAGEKERGSETEGEGADSRGADMRGEESELEARKAGALDSSRDEGMEKVDRGVSKVREGESSLRDGEEDRCPSDDARIGVS